MIAEVKNTMENKLYNKFSELFLEFAEGKYSYLRLESKGFEPLSLEWIFGDHISIMHTYELNGDLCYDPMMEFQFDNIGKTMSACMFQQSLPPVYQYFSDNGLGKSVDGNGNEHTIPKSKLQADLNNFASQWIDNIAEQGYIPVVGTLVRSEDDEIRVTFDKNGNIIMPKAENPQITESDLFMPDSSIGFSEMNLYGYSYDEMLPLTNSRAVELFDTNHCIYLLYQDNTEAMAVDRDEIRSHDGLCGIERMDWERSPVRAAQLAADINNEGSREAELLYGEGNKFGIYQIPDGIDETRNFRFASMRELEAHGLKVDRNNYKLVYTAPFGEQLDVSANVHHALNNIYTNFNTTLPSDYTNRSVSVSDVIVLKYDGDISSHFVDRVGFVELDAFLGEEHKNMPSTETTIQEQEINTTETLSQVGTSPSVLNVSKPKPTLMERLEANKLKAAKQDNSDEKYKSKNHEFHE